MVSELQSRANAVTQSCTGSGRAMREVLIANFAMLFFSFTFGYIFKDIFPWYAIICVKNL